MVSQISSGVANINDKYQLSCVTHINDNYQLGCVANITDKYQLSCVANINDKYQLSCASITLCYTYQWVTHINESHISMSHTYQWVTHINESCSWIHTRDTIHSHVFMCVPHTWTHMGESFHTCECVTSHARMSQWHRYESGVSHA